MPDDTEPSDRPTLDYGRPQSRSERAGLATQVTAGFFAWIAAVAAVIFFGTAIGVRSSAGTIPFWVVACAALGWLGWLTWRARVNYGWRGFLPGVLLGFFLTCLVPIGVIAVVCGPWKGL